MESPFVPEVAPAPLKGWSQTHWKCLGFAMRSGGSALQNTTESLLEEQSKPIPWRTVDISSGFDSSLASEEEVTTETVIVDLDLLPSETIGTPVRGLW